MEGHALCGGDETPQPVHLELLELLARPPLARAQGGVLRAGTRGMGVPESLGNRLSQARGHVATGVAVAGVASLGR